MKFIYDEKIIGEGKVYVKCKKESNFDDLKALHKIYKLTEKSGFAYINDIRLHLGKTRNKTIKILKKLHSIRLIRLSEDPRYETILLTSRGKEIFNKLLDELLAYFSFFN